MKIMVVGNELNSALKTYPQINCWGECEDLKVAMPIIREERPEIIFLDIDASGKNCFELLKGLDYHPKYIFSSGHTKYAARSFDFDVIDYLLKPYTPERLKRTIGRLILFKNKTSAVDKLNIDQNLLLNNGELTYWVSLKDIQYFESCANHSLVVWNKNKILIHRALVNIESRLPEGQFVRVNRKHIVNVSHVKKVESWINGGFLLEMGSTANIEVSRRQAGRFKDKFSL